MRGGVILSGLLHFSVLMAVVLGLPDLFKRDLEVAPPIAVEIASIDELTRPRPAPVPKPAPEIVEPEPEPEEIPEAPPPPPQPAASEPPPPPPEAPQQEAKLFDAAPPEPEPEPEPEPLPLPPEPKVEPEPEPKKEEPKVAPAPKPSKKPAVKLAKKPEPKKEEKKKKPEPDRLASILKNVEKLQEDTPTRRQPEPEQAAPQRASSISSQPMSVSEIDAVRQQIYPCWSPPVGAPNAEELAVEVRLFLNQDGSLRDARALDEGRMRRDRFYRAAADAAVRAVHRCTPLKKLPVKKYSEWSQMVLNFDPSEMLGQ